MRVAKLRVFPVPRTAELTRLPLFSDYYLTSLNYMVLYSMQVTRKEALTRANEILQECYTLAPDSSRRLNSVSFRLSNTVAAAGKARPHTGEIYLSMAYYSDRKNFENHFRNTVTHEIAHVLSPPTRTYNGRRKIHGAAWKAMHISLGGNGSTSGADDLQLSTAYQARRVTRKRSPRVVVTCPKCFQSMQLGPTQYKKWQRGAKYSHNKCPI